MVNNDKLGIYVHIPFCIKKCNYCDFLSFSATDKDKESYIDTLCNEIRLFCEGKSLKADSLFIGGGTPSVLEPRLIEKLMLTINECFEICEEAEITIEANPGTMDREKAEMYRQLGINRVSMGVQSLDESLLKRLGRIHSRKEFFETFSILREAGFENINTDLMFALPGQSQMMWEQTLKEILKIRPEHISFYSLIIEEGTPFYEDLKKGRLEQMDDENDRAMYHFAVQELKKQGYHHYEISNAALPGRESRHNLKYWNMQDYIGFGLGAHSFINRVRFCNTDDMKEYIKNYSNDKKASQPYIMINKNTSQDDAEELIFTGFRKTEGISKKYFKEYVGEDFNAKYASQIERLKKEQMLEENEDYIYLTSKGLDFANYVIEKFIV